MTVYRALIRPLLFALDPERAHHLAISWLSMCGGSAGEREGPVSDPILACQVFGLNFANPIGLAAGFDKNGQAVAGLSAMGFGLIEVGTVTPRPQPGNPKPRLFRVPQAQAVINRMGFNNQGMQAMAERLSRLPPPGGRMVPVGINIGRNKDSTDAHADYAMLIDRLAGLADYLVVNVSSPNTPGLRALQDPTALRDLLACCLAARGDAGPPLLLKVAPDLTPEDRRDIAAVALQSGIDGLVVANTTIERPPDLPDWAVAQAGGLSGAPLRERSTALIGEFYRLTGGRLPIIGVGGVASGADAYAKIKAGASLVQIYSAMVYEGPGLARKITAELAALARADGHARIADVIGTDMVGTGVVGADGTGMGT